MSSYALLVAKHRVNIIEDDTNTTVEMITNLRCCQELFFTQKEKTNNMIYEAIMSVIGFTTFVASYFIQLLILGEKPSPSGGMSLQGCFLMLFIFIILVFILNPILKFFKKKCVTKIKDIKLTFSSNGLEINPNIKNSNRKPIFIDTLNIQEICIREQEILKGSGSDSYTERMLHIILVLKKSIKEQFTNKEIKEIAIMEDIEKDDLEKAIKLAEKLKKALKI